MWPKLFRLVGERDCLNFRTEPPLQDQREEEVAPDYRPVQNITGRERWPQTLGLDQREEEVASNSRTSSDGDRGAPRVEGGQGGPGLQGRKKEKEFKVIGSGLGNGLLLQLIYIDIYTPLPLSIRAAAPREPPYLAALSLFSAP